VITFTCAASLENTITRVISIPERSVRVSWRQAWILRQLLQTEYKTEMYLMRRDELRVLRTEPDEPTDRDGDGDGDSGGDGHNCDSPTEYSPHQSQAIQQPSVTQRPPTSGRSFSPPSRLASPGTVVGTRYTPLGGDDTIEMQPLHASVHTKPSKIYPRLP